ncbi:TolC family protein [Cryomorphaceae bacterium]|nr:TolC family protein [Cryomorphaceae bacterium]
MNKLIYTFVLIAAVLYRPVRAQESGPVILSLNQAISYAQGQSITALQNETTKENRFWAYQSFRSNLYPRLVLSGVAPEFNRSFSGVTQPDGTTLYQPVTINNSSLQLDVSQNLPWTGGQVFIGTRLNRFDDFDRDTRLYNSSPLFIGLSQPLFQYNGLKWGQKIEPLKYEESVRQFKEEEARIAVQVCRRYFDLLRAEINLDIAENNLKNNDTLFRIAETRFELGRISKSDLLQLQLAAVTAQKDVAQAKLDRNIAALELKTFLGWEGDSLDAVLPTAMDYLNVNPELALVEARANRADPVAFRRRLLEAEEEVAMAKGQTGPQANLEASLGFSGTDESFGGAYQNTIDQQGVRLGFTIPILDWGRADARVKTALANQKLVEYTVQQDEINFDQNVIQLAERFNLLQTQIEFYKQGDELAAERYQISYDRYLLGDLSITDLMIALGEKDRARRDYLGALRDYWEAYYRLQLFTLYDFRTQQKR